IGKMLWSEINSVEYRLDINKQSA
ncbi:MAG: hypothetical protein UV02_C0015G0001, partial [Candidatus Kuenenbacteria bacterium GW2011_GWA2_42_15]